MNKRISLLLAGLLIFTATGCENKNKKTVVTDTTSESTTVRVTTKTAKPTHTTTVRHTTTEKPSTTTAQTTVVETTEAISPTTAHHETTTTEQTTSGKVRPGSKTNIAFNESWEFADSSIIHTGCAVLYKARGNRRKDITIGVNAGHGTVGGTNVYTYCHPDRTPKTTGGSTQAGALKAIAVSSGMCLYDGTPEADVTLRIAQIFRDKLLAEGFDVLMLRDDSDVQLDNIARTIMCNNNADCHISLHIDGDGLDYNKGCFYASVPDGIKNMYPVSEVWQESNALGESLISGLQKNGAAIYNSGSAPIDLTQTSYSKVPSIDIELGNAAMQHDDSALGILCDGMVIGIKSYYDVN